MVEMTEAVKILRELRRKKATWAAEYGTEYSIKVMEALELGADALELLNKMRADSEHAERVSE